MIRPCEVADIPTLLDLYGHLSPGDPPCSTVLATAQLQALRAIPGSGIYLAEAAGQLVASCTCVVIPNITRGGRPYALIENVVTHADHRRKGHGSGVLAAAVADALAFGCYKIMLMTGTSRQGTLDFYRSVGFSQTKTGFQIRA